MEKKKDQHHSRPQGLSFCLVILKVRRVALGARMAPTHNPAYAAANAITVRNAYLQRRINN